MNNLTTKVVIVALVAVAIIAGLYYWATNKSGTVVPTSTYTPPPTTTSQRKPGAPVVKTKPASYISQSAVVLNGDVNPNGAQTSYWYEYGQTQSLGSVAGTQLVGAGYGTYTAPTYVTGLKSNTTYYFHLVAVNQLGKTSGSILSVTTNNTPPPAYSAPTATTKSASDITTTSAVLNGLVNPKGVVTTYWFEFGENTGLGNATSVVSAGAGTSDVSVSSKISDLQPDKVYYFRINSQNGYGTTNGSIRSFKTNSGIPPLPIPTAQPTAETSGATKVTKSSATLNGQVNPNGAQTSYHFEYGEATLLGIFSLDQKTGSKSAGAGKVAVDVTSGLSGLKADTTYYFRLVAENKNGTDNGSILSFRTNQ